MKNCSFLLRCELGLKKRLTLTGLFLSILCFGVITHSAWITETVDDSGDVGQYPALAFDSNDIPHISYYDNSAGFKDLKHAFRDTSWKHETVDADGGAGFSSDLGIDPTTVQPCIAYLVYPDNELRYAKHDASGWQIETITDQFMGDVSDVSLDFGIYSSPHLSVVSSASASYTLYHVYHDGAVWNVEDLEYGSVNGAGIQTCIEMDQTEFYHIVYFIHSLKSGTLRYAYGMNQSAPVVIEDIVSYIGDSAGFGLDLLNQVHPEISYHDSVQQDVKFAIRSGAWVPQTVGTVASTGAQNSIRIDTVGNAHIAYYTGASGVLNYAFHDASGWHISTVDGIVGSGAYPALALDVSNRPSIAYYDTVNGNLKYAWLDDAACKTTGVDITMPSHMFHAGEICCCSVLVCNADAQELNGYPLFVLLAIGNTYFFAPGFTTMADNYLLQYPIFPIGGTVVNVLPEFIWPQGVASMNGLTWYAALTDPDVTQIYGSMDTFLFGWE